MQQESLERKRLIKPTEFGNVVVGNVGEGSVDGTVDGRSQNSVGR